ncbi:MAG: ABC transporter permease [Clostridiales bacterium]|jgi:spermidine/putrescine transport system permease protein|nr:ABC transporter permease [Clostridiales bacterium]
MKRTWYSYPYLVWMVIFIVIPFLLLLFYTFTVNTDKGLMFTLDHIKRLWDPIYLMVLLRSIVLAIICTIICLIIGYPVGLILASREYRSKKVLALLFVIPMWINFLLRTYAWMTLLEKDGLVYTILKFFRVPNPQLLYTDQAVVLGMVYNFLPFMVLPIYSVLTKLDKNIIEAAEDLGANYITILKRVIVPLSLPGVISGITMVFMPAVTTFIISRLLGGGHYILVGNLIEQQFMVVGDWHFGSAISFVLMVVILVSMGIMRKYDNEYEGGAIW